MRGALALLLLSASLIAAADEPPVARPDVKAGDRWTYRWGDARQKQEPTVYELEVTFVGPKAIKAIGAIEPSGRDVDTTWTPDWNVVTDRRSGSYYPDNGLLRFPLAPGAAYSSEFEIVRPRLKAFRVRIRIDVKVIGWEDIRVPAGKFRALKVEAPGTYQRLDIPAAGRVRYDLWYAPKAKRWVKFKFTSTDSHGQPEREETEELLAYRLYDSPGRER
jgi:hypothetical protein